MFGEPLIPFSSAFRSHTAARVVDTLCASVLLRFRGGELGSGAVSERSFEEIVEWVACV